jgi:hypothetical protein
LSEVFPDFHLLPLRFASEPARQFISDNELQYLTELSSNRFNFMYSEAHGLAYLLDPRSLGEKLNHLQRSALEDCIFSNTLDSGPLTEQQQGELFQEYTEFMISAQNEKNNNTFRFRMLSEKRKTALQY